MSCLSATFTNAVFVYLYLCICKADTWEHCFSGSCIITFQKIYGLYGLKHHIVEVRGDVTRRDDKRRTTMEDRATQPLGCWKAEFRNIDTIGVPSEVYLHKNLVICTNRVYPPSPLVGTPK